ncbi:MAG: hypothetical protein MZW92_52155 [Comamonadaceae bacterium]|nr:hypothetical protein [Comamonadaceae bacterium]
MKQALQYAAPFDFVAWRTLPAALLLFAVMLARRQSLAPTAPLALFRARSTCRPPDFSDWLPGRCSKAVPARRPFLPIPCPSGP